MSLGGGSSPRPPKLRTVDIPSAESLVYNQNVRGYNLADTNYATDYTGPLVTARNAMISDLEGQTGGGISPIATGALNTAGLGDVAKNIVGGNEFQTARNLGEPILEKEKRDRNYADTLLAANPKRSFTLSPQDILDIVTSNSGNVNAYRQGVFQTQSQQSNFNALQQAQTISGIASLLGSGANIFSKYQASQYSDPFGTAYSYNFPGLGYQTSYYGPNAEVFGFPSSGGGG